MPTPIPRAACARAPLATTSITLLRPGILHSHHFKGTAWGMPQHTTVTHPRSLRTHASTCPGSIVMSSITTPLGSVTDQDRAYVRQAIDLAARALGQTHPNPAVGCVIVKDGEVVGEGFHPKAGMPHAEVYALRAAGNAAKGATAYVTLEPCNHHGRTPPCSLALVDAGVARVVVGVTDPNPLVGGQGIATLRDAGIEVELVGGQEEASCYEMNKDFMVRMQAQAAGGG